MTGGRLLPSDLSALYLHKKLELGPGLFYRTHLLAFKNFFFFFYTQVPFVKDIVQLALTRPVLTAECSALAYPTPRCGKDKLAMSPAHQVQPQGKGLGGPVDLGCFPKALRQELQGLSGSGPGDHCLPSKGSPSPPSATNSPSLVLHWHCRSLRGPTQPKRTADVCMDL